MAYFWHVISAGLRARRHDSLKAGIRKRVGKGKHIFLGLLTVWRGLIFGRFHWALKNGRLANLHSHRTFSKNERVGALHKVVSHIWVGTQAESEIFSR
jgi:hypothetical protein